MTKYVEELQEQLQQSVANLKQIHITIKDHGKNHIHTVYVHSVCCCTQKLNCKNWKKTRKY